MGDVAATLLLIDCGCGNVSWSKSTPCFLCGRWNEYVGKLACVSEYRGYRIHRLWAFLLSADAARVSSQIVTLWVGSIRGVFMEFGSQAWFTPFTLQQI